MSTKTNTVDLSVAPELLDATTFCMQHPRGHEDAAKRMADHVNMHYAANQLGVWDALGKWLGVRLDDGGTDQVAYDTMGDAVRHTDEMRCTYIRLNGMRMDPCEAQMLLDVHRRARENGFRQADPDARSGGRQLLLSSRTEVRREVLAILRKGRA